MQYASRAIPLATQRLVLARDGMVCRWCGVTVTTAPGYRADKLHFDHVKPWGAGGGHEVDNLVVSCAPCNLSRPKPVVNVREAHDWVEYRYGRYWWPEGYEPPVALVSNRCSVLLADAAQELRTSALALVRAVHQGRLPASGQGEPVSVQLADVPAPRRGKGRRRA